MWRRFSLVEKFDIEPFSEPNHQTLEGSFSAVSTPNFATKASFFSILCHFPRSTRFAILCIAQIPKIQQNFAKFLQIFEWFEWLDRSPIELFISGCRRPRGRRSSPCCPREVTQVGSLAKKKDGQSDHFEILKISQQFQIILEPR